MYVYHNATTRRIPMSTTSIGKYTTHEFLGSGSFGSVVKASREGSDKWFAIKRISKQLILRSSMGKQVKKEISIMKILRHPNIVRTEEVLMSSKYIFICMEHVTGGELSTRVASVGKLEESLASKFTRQLCEAMEFCHGQNICHRDIKPQNILLDREENVKLVDFGFSSFMEFEVEDQKRSFAIDEEHVPIDEFEYDLNFNLLQRSTHAARLKKMHTYCGTVQYMAPEISSGNDYFGDKVDMWSIGMVVYFMLTGGIPPTAASSNWYTRGRLQLLLEKVSKTTSVEAVKVLRNLLVVDADTRYTASEILRLPWLIGLEETQTKYLEDVDCHRSTRIVSTSSSYDSDLTTEFNVSVRKDFDKKNKTLMEYVRELLEKQAFVRNTRTMGNEMNVLITTSAGVALFVVTVVENKYTQRVSVEMVRGECSSRQMTEIKEMFVHME